jgi:hypothetical protein
MRIPKKKVDPISDRERQLKEEIAALESQIQKLSSNLSQKQPQPRLRSTVIPHGTAHPTRTPGHPEPVFEAVDHERIKSPVNSQPVPGQYNAAGVRKYDLPALFRRIQNLFRSPQPSNHKLLTLLATGNVQGLRPLRYEKRIARNRLLAWVIILSVVLWGLLAMSGIVRFISYK